MILETREEDQMKTYNITKELLQGLSYYTLCKLSDYLNIVNPTQVNVVGSITLDDLGNFISADAFVETDELCFPVRGVTIDESVTVISVY